MRVPDLRYWIRIVPASFLYLKYRDCSMIRYRAFVENLMIASLTVRTLGVNDAAIIECGTWKGGMAGALIEMCGRSRTYAFFDTFDGLPAAREIDGPRAVAWQKAVTSEDYFDNCRASLSTFIDTISRSGIAVDKVAVYEGLFEKTFPEFESRQIQILRLDADWYDSTIICLEKFWDDIVQGGLVLIDDYYGWDGCSRAVHDFLSARRATERIRQGRIGGVAYIVKE